ncbi:MAG: alpha-glucan family phosphorylase [Parachlamydiaceae bacterium]
MLYSQGYFRQFIDINREQQALYPYNDPGQLPVKPLRTPDGEWLRLKIDLPGWPLWIRTWEAQVGHRKLYLLDTNDIANFPAYRGITSELYGGDRDLRIKQEIVLGIGGWLLLEALQLDPEVCHLNEGHAAFVVLARARAFMKRNGLSFEEALAATRAGNLFTTHTAVAAGFDQFPCDMVLKYLKGYAENQLLITKEQLLALGTLRPGDDFNMAYLAIRGSTAVNAVSKLHEEVSKALFAPLFPRWPYEEIPIQHVTNGVHMPSWDSSFSDELWTEVCSKKRWLGETEKLQKAMRQVPEEKIWNMRNESRARLVEFARRILTRQLIVRGIPKEEVDKVSGYLNKDVLTLGFARRFASYKRPDLLLTDPERLLKILKNRDRPVQLLLAGKAHPADRLGQFLIKRWIDFISDTDARTSVVFLSDYDMNLTEQLVQGVDLWINTPRRPWEACGTSGMKVLVNGGLNLSELDGWWAEAYAPDVGWALGDKQIQGDDEARDRYEANVLYELLENEVVPKFYRRDEKNIPREWTEMIKESMARLTPYFSSNRAVRDYTEMFYLPMAEKYRARSRDKGIEAVKLAAWEKSLNENWEKVSFGGLMVEQGKENNLYKVQLISNGIDLSSIKVELYSPTVVKEMQRTSDPAGEFYCTEVSNKEPFEQFTPRIIPRFPGASIPLEAEQILWQK